MNALLKMLPARMRENLLIRIFAFTKIRMLHFVAPYVVELTDERCVVRIRLNRRTRNHLNSMYFGVLAAGADMAGGVIS